MKRVVVIAAGGSIAVKSGPMVGGSVPLLKGDEFLSRLPRDGLDLVFEEFTNIPSSHFTPAKGLDLSHRIESVVMMPDVDAVVVTHGSDTLEETAYLLDLTLTTTKPIVCTSSMRAATSPGYDGVLNLANAIRVATTPEARDLGVLVVVGDEIFAASEVQKVHTHAQHAFQAPGNGPLGYVDVKQVRFSHRPSKRAYISCAHLEEMVDLIRLTQGADDRLLRHSIEDGVAGIVIETFGSGRVPPWWLPAIGEALTRRTTVAVTTRCTAGGLGDTFGYVGAYHDLQRLGVVFADNLSGPKARIKLMVALGAARNQQELRTWFQ